MSTLVMSLGMIAFFAVVMTIAWRRYQRHAAKAAERSRAAMVQLLTDSEVVAAQFHGEISGENQAEGAQDATASPGRTTMRLSCLLVIAAAAIGRWPVPVAA
ncbi:MAG: hypothetical protein EBY42_09905, partial [Actinobacteria bacterium]|nr:hypothetical protein [Actinomycetota bacterium]